MRSLFVSVAVLATLAAVRCGEYCDDFEDGDLGPFWETSELDSRGHWQATSYRELSSSIPDFPPPAQGDMVVYLTPDFNQIYMYARLQMAEEYLFPAGSSISFRYWLRTDYPGSGTLEVRRQIGDVEEKEPFISLTETSGPNNTDWLEVSGAIPDSPHEQKIIIFGSCATHAQNNIAVDDVKICGPDGLDQMCYSVPTTTELVTTTESPTTETSTTENPTTESPTTENPTTETSTTENPTTESTTTENPTTESTTTQNPTTESPTTENPTTESPTTENPTTESTTTDSPTTESPTTENPTTESPTTENPTTENPTTEHFTTETPTTSATPATSGEYCDDFESDDFGMFWRQGGGEVGGRWESSSYLTLRQSVPDFPAPAAGDTVLYLTPSAGSSYISARLEMTSELVFPEDSRLAFRYWLRSQWPASGTLYVKRQIGQQEDAEPLLDLTYTAGPDNDQWQEASVEIPADSRPAKIIIFGACGTSPLDNIAIDDIRVYGPSELDHQCSGATIPAL